VLHSLLHKDVVNSFSLKHRQNIRLQKAHVGRGLAGSYSAPVATGLSGYDTQSLQLVIMSPALIQTAAREPSKLASDAKNGIQRRVIKASVFSRCYTPLATLAAE